MTATVVRTAPPVLDLDARLALVDAVMTVRLEEAAVAHEVRTAHLSGADPIPHHADLLHRARVRIETDGWCRNALFDDQGAICPIRAIRLEAATRGQADDACVLLLDRIQADWPTAETIPSWNAQQASPAPVLRAFERAADYAHIRGL